MPKLTFFRPLPSSQEFKTAEAAANFASEQYEHWVRFVLPIQQGSDDGFPAMLLANKWNEFAGNARAVGNDAPDSWRGLEQIALNEPLIPFDSEVGIAMREIAATHGPTAFNGAMRAVAGDRHATRLNGLNVRHLIGITQIQSLMPPASQQPKNVTKAFRSRLEALDRESANTLKMINELENEARQNLDELQKRHGTQEADYGEWREIANDQITGQYQEWGNERAKLRAALVEDLRVRAPVIFWNEQAAKHEEKARVLRSGSWITGAAGLAIVAIASTLVVQWITRAEPFKAQPTVQLFSMIAAVALISSLYLWLMRLVVRFYVSEIHLATDASSRAALTTTYLALLKEDAVKPEDRAIVLTALFRPPQDGIVKDDGMPMLSAGAALSGLLGGKQGAA